MLHVLNGDATAATFRALGLPGEAIVWREMFTQGPFPRALHDSAAWEERAQWLSRRIGIDPRAYLAEMTTMRDALRDAKEVVLWSEDDLFCQLALCYHLSLKPEHARWEVIVGDEKLGPLSAPRLLERYQARREVGSDLARAGAAAWGAVCSPDPRALASSEIDARAWPGLAKALALQRARLPDASGLGVVERLVLDAIPSEAPAPIRQVFARVAGSPLTEAYGLADLEVGLIVEDLGRADPPLVMLDPAQDVMDARERAWLATCRVVRTRAGEAVLRGEAEARGMDRWVGGVHVRT